MSVANFIPVLWDSKLQVELRNSLVYGSGTVCNRKYQGQLQQQGQSVTVNRIVKTAIEDHNRADDIDDVDELSTTSAQLIVDKAKRWQFLVQDLDVVQAAGDFVTEAVTSAAYDLAKVEDTHIASKFADAIAANKIAGVAGDSAYSLLVRQWKALYKAGVENGGYAICGLDVYEQLLNDNRFIDYSASGEKTLHNGQVGKAANFNILVSAITPPKAIHAGVPMAISHAQQLLETEAYRSHKKFGDVVRGLDVFGTKVFYPEAISVATIS